MKFYINICKPPNFISYKSRIYNEARIVSDSYKDELFMFAVVLLNYVGIYINESIYIYIYMKIT